MNTVTVNLPSGRVAVVRDYNAFCANAIGDQALQEAGTAWHKAVSGVCETMDGEPYPGWGENQKACLDFGDKMLMNDIMLILFTSVAKYHDGNFVGDVPLPTGDVVNPPSGLQLLDEDGSPLPEFTPPEYQLGIETKCEWTERIEELDSDMKFSFKLMTGARFRELQTQDTDNLLAQYGARKAMFENIDKPGQMRSLDLNRRDTPTWATKAIGKKVREVDPMMTWAVSVRHRSRNHKVSLFGIPDFFLRDFT